MPASKLTPELIERACDLREASVSIPAICEALEISETTYHAWNRRGQIELDRIALLPEESPPEPLPTEALYAELRRGLTRAKGRDKRSLLEIVQDAAPDDWRAASWLLSARHGISEKKGIEHSGKQVTEVRVTYRKPDDS